MQDTRFDVLKDYMTKVQLAEELGIATRTVNRYMTEPDGLPHVVVGGKAYFKTADVMQWLDKRTFRPAPRRAYS